MAQSLKEARKGIQTKEGLELAKKTSRWTQRKKTWTMTANPASMKKCEARMHGGLPVVGNLVNSRLWHVTLPCSPQQPVISSPKPSAAWFKSAAI